MPFSEFPPSPPLSQGIKKLFHASCLFVPDFAMELAALRAAFLTQAGFVRLALSLRDVSGP